jgi:hypothetical protein
MDKDIFTAIIANDKAEALLTVKEFYNALGCAEHNAGSHIARGARATKAAAAGTTAEAAAAAATATAKTAAAAAAETVTAATAAAVTTTAAAAETITAAAAIAATFKLVEPALTLVETTTTSGTTSASIKAHFLSKSSIVSRNWCPSAAMR